MQEVRKNNQYRDGEKPLNGKKSDEKGHKQIGEDYPSDNRVNSDEADFVNENDAEGRRNLKADFDENPSNEE